MNDQELDQLEQTMDATPAVIEASHAIYGDHSIQLEKAGIQQINLAMKSPSVVEIEGLRPGKTSVSIEVSVSLDDDLAAFVLPRDRERFAAHVTNELIAAAKK